MSLFHSVWLWSKKTMMLCWWRYRDLRQSWLRSGRTCRALWDAGASAHSWTHLHRRQVTSNKLQVYGKCKTMMTCVHLIFPQISAQVSAQVRKELETLFFGSSGAGELPESLLHWLSQRYVSTPDLQASLASLEMAILRNVSLQLEQNRATTLGEAESQAKSVFHTVSGAVQHTAAAEGLTEEVKMLLTSWAVNTPFL